MKKTASTVLFAVLCAAAGASWATVHVECHQAHGKCVPPTPPTPPAPPAPPTPPAPPAGAIAFAPPALPQLPPLPAIPAPPPPPPVPDVPAAAHAACAGKADGTDVTYTMGKGEYMRGVCEKDGGKMTFQLRMYHKD